MDALKAHVRCRKPNAGAQPRGAVCRVGCSGLLGTTESLAIPHAIANRLNHAACGVGKLGHRNASVAIRVNPEARVRSRAIDGTQDVDIQESVNHPISS
jgi:hypothetical protein